MPYRSPQPTSSSALPQLPLEIWASPAPRAPHLATGLPRARRRLQRAPAAGQGLHGPAGRDGTRRDGMGWDGTGSALWRGREPALTPPGGGGEEEEAGGRRRAAAEERLEAAHGAGSPPSALLSLPEDGRGAGSAAVELPKTQR